MTSSVSLTLGVSEWSPLDIAGLAAWYDFSDPTTLYTDAGTTLVSSDGDSIYQANDKSGNGKHLLQSSSGSRPLYKVSIQGGRSVGRFDSNDYMESASSVAVPEPYSLVVVGTAGVNGSYAIVVVDRDDQPFFTVINGGNALLGAAGGSGPVWTAYGTGFHIGTIYGNGSSSHIARDGDYSGDSSIDTGGLGWSTSGITVGANADHSLPWTGDVAMILLYDSVLGATNHNALGIYLSTLFASSWTTAVL